MATSSKSKNRIGKIVFGIFVMLLVAAAALYGAKKIYESRKHLFIVEDTQDTLVTVGNEAVFSLYNQFYVLYAQCMSRQELLTETVGDLFLEPDRNYAAYLAKSYVWELLQEWQGNSGGYHFCYKGSPEDDAGERIVGMPYLQKVLSGEIPDELEALCQCCIFFSIDNQGNLSVQIPYSRHRDLDARIIRTLYEAHLEASLEKRIFERYGPEMAEEVKFRTMQPFQAVIAIPEDMDAGLYISHGSPFWYNVSALSDQGTVLFFALGLAMLLLVLLLRSKRVCKDSSPARLARKGKTYFAEMVIVAGCFIAGWYDTFLTGMVSFHGLSGILRDDAGIYVSFLLVTLILEVLWFFGFWYLRPLFSLGFKEYMKQYSLLCLFGRGCKRRWEWFVEAIDKVDFGKKSGRLILKAVILNFVILLVCVSTWFFGIAGLIVYSVLLFSFLKTRYDRAAAAYANVLRETDRMAEGELSEPVTGDFGMFVSLGENLRKVKEGFRKAVEKEVKSERMKTELITNVSHDLKTPLTAIMTYVELLKKEDITEEERTSYIATLESKSKRLKVLIEDLFEVSRAASNNLTLNVMDMDLVQMVKQMAVEYEDKFSAAGLNLRQLMPDGRVMVQLDGQKTFRILENLFTNICKYAMPGSRVYAEVSEREQRAVVTLKNISANELTISADEIVERFVRGDASRNTEGSGLGLAIAKNLTEAQGGTFAIEIDGDLFKAELSFPLKEDSGEAKESLPQQEEGSGSDGQEEAL